MDISVKIIIHTYYLQGCTYAFPKIKKHYLIKNDNVCIVWVSVTIISHRLTSFVTLISQRWMKESIPILFQMKNIIEDIILEPLEVHDLHHFRNVLQSNKLILTDNQMAFLNLGGKYKGYISYCNL